MDGFHFSRVLPWHFFGIGLQLGFRVWILRFLRIRFRWFFFGSGWFGFLRIGIRLFFRIWIFGFLLGLDSVFLLLDVRFLKGSGCLFFGSGLFRLLIQRCKNVTGTGNLFDKGGIRLDEGEICPTNGFFGGVAFGHPGGGGYFGR